MSPAAAASNTTNEVHGSIEGSDNSASVCQLLIVGATVLVLSIEDTLGLATLFVEGPLPLIIPVFGATNGTSSCDTSVGEIRIPHAKGNLVTGGHAVGIEPDGDALFAGNRTLVALPGNAFSICQRVIMLEMVLIGATPYGLPKGRTFEAFDFSNDTGDAPDAACRVHVGNIIIEQA